MKNLLLLILLISGSVQLFSQTDTIGINIYEGLALKDLLNVKIVSVSKTSELLFDAPLSASVVTKEAIRRAGSTSIMEALRLIPGIIVREQSNGNYDIHLRGMDNAPPNTPFDLASNTTTLVMIDSRPIYSYFKGGTFWETLPIDLNDVEKIEVVRGPSAALYGPNAVNGVINIITRQLKKDGLYTVVNAQQGSYHTFINNASVGYKSDKWSILASGNYQYRERTQTSYFEYYGDKWIDHPTVFTDFNGNAVTNIDSLYPDPRLSLKKYAANIFLNYDATEDIKFALTTGTQHSTAQKVGVENISTPFSVTESDTRYIDFRGDIKKVSAHFSYNKGTQIRHLEEGFKYDFNVLDANIEYNYTKGRLSIKPGASYTSAIYDDTQYSDTINKTGFFNARGEITTLSASLRGEYKLLHNKLRLVAGITTSTFNYPNTTYLSYQFAGTYKLNKKHLLRAVYSRAPRSSSIYDTYVDQTASFFPSGFQKFTKYILVGNKNIKLLTANMFEIGYRGNIAPGLNIDIELFNIQGKNYNSLIEHLPTFVISGSDTIDIRPVTATNLPLKLHQQGVTVSLSYTSKKLQIKPFATWQHTTLIDYAAYNNNPGVRIGFNPIPPPVHIYSGMGTKKTHKSTPAVYGGTYINYAITSKLNANCNLYYYTSQVYQHVSNLLLHDGVRGIDHIPGKLIINASVSYAPVKSVRIFLNGKNLLNNKSREFYRTDEVPFMCQAGFNFEL